MNTSDNSRFIRRNVKGGKNEAGVPLFKMKNTGGSGAERARNIWRDPDLAQPLLYHCLIDLTSPFSIAKTGNSATRSFKLGSIKVVRIFERTILQSGTSVKELYLGSYILLKWNIRETSIHSPRKVPLFQNCGEIDLHDNNLKAIRSAKWYFPIEENLLSKYDAVLPFIISSYESAEGKNVMNVKLQAKWAREAGAML